jgi:hypothetical protein
MTATARGRQVTGWRKLPMALLYPLRLYAWATGGHDGG